MKTLFVMDSSLSRALRPALEEDGVLVDTVPRASEADAKIQADAYDGVVVDHGRLDGEGLAHVRRWRSAGAKSHILVLLPADCDTIAKCSYLDAGADGYLLQPFCVEELQARLRAWGRRGGRLPQRVLRAHDLEIDTNSRRVRRGGQSIELTPREFDLLLLLAQCQGRVVSRSTILEALYDGPRDNPSNIVDVYIRYLRVKIDEGFDPPLILTRRGQGYLLRAAET
jgi:DNA-binding response OmpR family regulator